MMKPYPEYKDSGIEWIGKIPIHWNIMKLKFSDSIIMGQSPDSEDYNTMKIGLPFLQGTADFTDIHPEPRIYCASAKKTSIKNDILLSVRAPIGEVNISDQTFGIGRGLCAIRANKSFQKYLYYCMLSLNQELNSIGTGSTYKAVSIEDIENLYMVQPESIEQKAIASFISHKTHKIDELIAGKERLIELLREQRAAVINHAVTKGLDPHVKMKDSGIPWLGDIPEHWQLKKLKFFSDIVLGKMLTPEDKGNYYKKPYLRAINILWEKVDCTDVNEMWFSDKELQQYRVKLNDLLISEGGEVGRAAIWRNELEECYIQNSVHKVTLRENYDPRYFLYLAIIYGKVGFFESVVNKVSIGHLTREKLSEILFVCPPYDEQKAISKYIVNKISAIDLLINKQQKLINQLKEYRKTLISDVVTGKIDVRGFEP